MERTVDCGRTVFLEVETDSDSNSVNIFEVDYDSEEVQRGVGIRPEYIDTVIAWLKEAKAKLKSRDPDAMKRSLSLSDTSALVVETQPEKNSVSLFCEYDTEEEELHGAHSLSHNSPGLRLVTSEPVNDPAHIEEEELEEELRQPVNVGIAYIDTVIAWLKEAKTELQSRD